MKVENAQVDSLHIGTEGHGIPSFMVMLRFQNYHQGYGGYDLRYQDYALRLITGLCRVFQTDNITNIVGKYCRAEIDGGKIIRIGNIFEDVWFDITEGEK
jgi:hypothetical protein